ncbi:MAG: recombinase family protein [Chloroflexi bacterium]|nr:recombinase family protein [Chloroflexota bacterium]MCI0825796.1 recombinase family protein [Chloroflexota bacterium]MCI0896541.1 recombinase family protein [Chloroflexota bacterium]
MANQLRAIVYSRVSTDAQERDGTSLDTQEQACIDHIEASGGLVLECIRDTASGYTLDRPGIARIRQLLRQGLADVVVAYAVDRLSRNQNHIGVLFDEVQQAGVQFDFVTEKFEDTAIGRFILAARAFIAEVEREKISERTMRGKAERARSGRIPQGTGKGCYGYVYDPITGRREVDTFQGLVVQRIFEDYSATRSFSAVSSELNGAGIPSFTGARWYPLTIRRILTNESYAGRFIYRRTKRVYKSNGSGNRRHSEVVKRPNDEWIEVEGASPRVIDETLWQRV